MNADSKTESHKEAVIYFISRFDLEMLDAILEEQYHYNHCGKEELLYNLRIVFNDFDGGGDTHLDVHENQCECSISKENFTAITFIGNTSKRFLDLILKSENGKVVDIFECTEMKNHSDSIQKGGRIFLNEAPF